MVRSWSYNAGTTEHLEIFGLAFPTVFAVKVSQNSSQGSMFHLKNEVLFRSGSLLGRTGFYHGTYNMMNTAFEAYSSKCC